MKSVLLLSFCVLLMCDVYSQNIESKDIKYYASSYYGGRITLSQDNAIKDYMELVVGLNKKRKGFNGYRVKVYAQNHQNARREATYIVEKFRNGEYPAYLTYVAPNFEVLVGDFTSRFQAIRLLKKIKDDYPEAYIKKTVITYPDHTRQAASH